MLIQSTREQQEELVKFYETISPSLKSKVAIEIFSSVINRNENLTKVVTTKLNELSTADGDVERKFTISKVFKKKVSDLIVSSIAEKLTTQLKQPEDVIVHQFGEEEDMFIIARGECVVNIRDEKNKLVKKYKILGPSEYFGEISLIYGCKRTATIVSRKYTTLAKLSKQTY